MSNPYTEGILAKANKQFFLFVYDENSPNGGLEDVYASYETRKEAEEKLLEIYNIAKHLNIKGIFVEIFDRKSGDHICLGDLSND